MRFRLCMGLGLWLLALPVWADLPSGVEAYRTFDYGKAQRILEASAKQGDEVAGDVATFLEKPLQPRAARWLALERLEGGVMLNGRFGSLFFLPKSKQAARAAVQPHAEAGNPTAQLMLAMMLHTGQGGPVDLPAAFRWYRAAAARGEVAAMENLGALYLYGPASLRDPAAGLVLWQKAASAGSVNSQYNLGVSYFLGDGVPRDVDAALNWWRLAAESNGLLPLRALAETHAELGEKDPYHAGQALMWYQQAARQGDATAQYELARIYRYGWGVARDERLMLNWYRQAALNKHEDALKILRELFHAGDHVAQDLPMAYALAVLMHADGDLIFYQQRIDSQMSEAQRTEARVLAARVTDKAQLAAALAERLDKPALP